MNERRTGHVRISLIISLLVAVMVAGCGYTLQGRADLPFDAVEIGEIKNTTGEPKLQDRMNRLLAETFMQYGVDIRSSARYRIDGEINKFEVYPVAERNLQALEYQLNISGNFKIIDTRNKKMAELNNIAAPFLVYFRSSGMLVNVLAAKETATEQALKDLSQEVVLRIVYKMPAMVDEPAKKGDLKIEPKTVPAGK
jgi:outer membrane lipopolysaccharide assembly protein LptE/RlpB